MIIKKEIKKKKFFNIINKLLLAYFFFSIAIISIPTAMFLKSSGFKQAQVKFLDKFSRSGRINYIYLPEILYGAVKSNFSNFEKINLEIGFGNGEFLIKNAISKPEELFIGVEVYLNGIAKVLKTISDFKLTNILLSNLNCSYFLPAISDKSVDRIFIINPDPWTKKRHHKRRLISYKIIKLLKQIIKTKDSIFITTDSESYLKDIKNLLSSFRETFGDYTVNIIAENDELYGISRYQRKAIEIGGKIYLLKLWINSILHAWFINITGV